MKVNKIFSKITAATLVAGCVILSSPGVMLANVSEDLGQNLDQELGQTASSEAGNNIETVVSEEEASDNNGETNIESEDFQNEESDAPQEQEQLQESELQTEGEPSENSAEESEAVDEEELATEEEQVSDNASEESSEEFVESENQDVNDPVAENSETGENSENNSTATTDNTTDIENENYAEVFNDSFLRADTGNNSANYNTGSGIITTNKANGNGQLINALNINRTYVAGSNDVFGSGENQDTGADSDNQSNVNINNQLTVKNINEANVINRLQAEITSGKNSAKYNTGHGMIATGPANLGVNFFSIANTNLFGSNKFYANAQNIYNSYAGNIDLSNELTSHSSPLSSALLQAANNSTGEDSNNDATVNLNNETIISNQNKGSINNEVDAFVISGQNNADYNTGTGSIASGKVNSSVNVINFLNSNISSGNTLIKTLNIFGSWQGDLKLPAMDSSVLSTTENSSDSSSENSNTGADSENETDLNVNNSVELTNNNQAVIENNVNFDADSGNNKASLNNGAGIVQVGSVRGETNQMNIANLNITGNSWWLVVVNRFGNWNGTAVNASDSVSINSTGVSTILTPMQSGVLVQNNTTGSGSNNSAGADVNDSTIIENSNQASIKNNLNIHAISGQNSTEKNTGHGYIQTGDIKGANNIINFANSNITVGDWIVVVVNVFGDWDGDLVFNTLGGGSDLPVGGSLTCPVFPTGSSENISQNNSTGSDSTNNASSNQNNSNSIGNNNSAGINNTTDISATTGQNEASYNTGSGTVTTGGADAGSSVGNQANTNSTQTGSGSGESSESSNENTGSASENSSDSEINNNSQVENNNENETNNDISGQSNTGQNTSNYNTGSGSVDTGWAEAFLNLMNKVNDNTITIGDLTDAMEKTSYVESGGQVEVPSAESSLQSCPGVTVEVSPLNSIFAPGQTQVFSAVAKGPAGEILETQPEFTFEATGGTIDENGNYTAGSEAGFYAVTASASYGNKGTANIEISIPQEEEPEDNTEDSSGNGGGGGGSNNPLSNSGGGGGGGPIYLASSPVKKRLAGDFNNDGKIDDLDFSILMARWGQSRIGYIEEDSGKGAVGDKDFSIVMSNWSKKTIALVP